MRTSTRLLLKNPLSIPKKKNNLFQLRIELLRPGLNSFSNLGKILEADEVHVCYHKISTGTHFDLEATYILTRILSYKKRVVFVNREEFVFENNEFTT